MAQKDLEEESDAEDEESTTAKEEVQVSAKEKLEEIDLGTNSQKPRPISISSKLSKEEKLELILLLKEFRVIFSWEYSKMLGLDPRLLVRECRAKGEASGLASHSVPH